MADPPTSRRRFGNYPMSEIKGRAERLYDLARALRLPPNHLPTLRLPELQEYERLKDLDHATKEAYIQEKVRELAEEARELPDEELLFDMTGRRFSGESE
jgi:hypothetical protein